MQENQKKPVGKVVLRRFWWIFTILLLFVGLGMLWYNLFFLRLPKRVIVEDPSVFLSPANGKVISIVTWLDSVVEKNHRVVIEDAMRDTGDGSTMVSIMMTPLNVHYQRLPQTSDLIDQVYHKGKFLNAMTDPAATFENEYNAMLFQTPTWTKYKVIQIAGKMARRIVSFVQPWASLKQGDVIGVIKLGSQVTIIFDNTVEVTAQVGDVLHEWLTVIGKFK